jgi:circadian clock protein KaiB
VGRRASGDRSGAAAAARRAGTKGGGRGSCIGPSPARKLANPNAIRLRVVARNRWGVRYRPERSRLLTNYILRLYVTGKTPRAERAIANLRRICEEELRGQYEMQVIDVLEHPQLAEDEKILATPTLIKQLPLPLRRVIGDLSDKEKVLLGLDFWPAQTQATPDEAI